jgi:hypothetical protein
MTMPLHKVPQATRVDVWDRGDYVHAQAGDGAEHVAERELHP